MKELGQSSSAGSSRFFWATTAHLCSGWNRFVGTVAPALLGRHPHNTLLSFNYFNVCHINRYFQRYADDLKRTDCVAVDVGSGSSPYFEYLWGHVSEYLAIDVKGSLPPNETRPIRQLEGFAESLPVPDASADIVISNQVLEHVIDVDKAVREANRILKPGGTFIGSVPHISPVHLEPYDFRRFTSLGLTQILEKHGFRQIEVEGNCGVFATAAFMIGMDLVLSRSESGKPQHFSMTLAVLLSPVIGLINIGAMVFDFLFANKNRSYANLCWKAVKS